MGAIAASATVHPAQGTIEICKSGDNGMTGRSFSFALNGGSAISVKGGGCSGPMSTGWGVNTVVEAPTAGLRVAAIASNRLVDDDLASGTAHVRVVKDSTPANETVVTYTNDTNKALGLKVCKAADAPLVGQSFSFSENGGAAFGVTAGTPAAPNCSAVKKYPIGTVVHVAELAVPNVAVKSIVVSDNRGSNVNLASGTVDATIGSGVTVVTYTNQSVPPTQFGYLELCKTRADRYVTGSFDFTITAPNFSAKRSVPVGNCSDAIRVPAGTVSIAETARAPYFVTAIGVSPSGRLVSRNVTNGTVTVSVPVGDASTETLVKFRNETTTSQIKVCKALTSNSAALTGRVFSFTVSDVNGQHTDRVVAGPPGTTNCKLDKSLLPVGSSVSITEKAAPNVQVVGVAVAPASQDAGSSGSTARLVVGAGTVTIATFTNEAYGTIEVCKVAADLSTSTQTFHFSINGGAAISVPANQCSEPISVPAGTATVAESGPANFHLVGVVAKGPNGDSRLVSGATDNPATVQVPYGGVANETVAEFTNAVNTGEFKICKVSPEPTLQGTSFDFTYSYTLPGAGAPTQGTASLEPGQCSLLSGDIPVVDPQGEPIPVYITEAATPSVEVSNITVKNGTLAASDYSAGTATVYVNRGFTTVTYKNIRTPVGGGDNRIF